MEIIIVYDTYSTLDIFIHQRLTIIPHAPGFNGMLSIELGNHWV